MALKETGSETTPDVYEWPGGFTWIAYPEETLERASHALVVDEQIWLIDPLWVEGISDRLEGLGTVVGVIPLIQRHSRASLSTAREYEVPVYVPRPLEGKLSSTDVEVEPISESTLPAGYRILTVIDRPFWHESMLVANNDDTLVVPEVLGTAPHYSVAGQPLGVHPMARVFPPRRPFESLHPDRILVGHGPPILEDAPAALEGALRNARKHAPRAYMNAFRSVVS